MIKSVDIKAFGKFSDFHMDFRQGINLILEENGFGKTTLAAFIGAMFYGLPETASKDLNVNTRLKYVPWGRQDKFGGSMVFSFKGEDYRVLREFGAKAKDDTARLICLSTNKSASAENLGERLFGLGYNDFVNCFFVPQDAVRMDTTDNFSEKISMMTGGGNCDEAIKTLDAKIVEIKQKRRSYGLEQGFLPDAERKVESAKRAINEAEERRAEVLRQEAALEQTEARLVAVADEKQACLNTLEAKKTAKYEYEAARALSQRSEKEKKEALSALPQCDYKKIPQRIEKAKRLLAQRNKTSKAPMIFGISGGAAALIAVILAAAKEFGIMAAFAVLAALAFVLAAVLWAKDAKRKKETEAEIKNLLLPAFVIDSYGQAIAELNALYEKHLSLTGTHAEMPEPFDAAEYDRISAKLEIILGEEEKEKEFRAKLVERIGIARENLPDIAELKERLEEAKREASALAERFAALNLAKECAEKTKENLSKAFLPEMSRALEKNMSYITGDKFGGVDVRIEENKAAKTTGFALTPVVAGMPREFDYFSKGEKEAALFCMKMALGELIYKGDMPFVLVDDAFVNYGESSFARTAELLKNYAKKTQIIYLTCHNRGKLLL